MKAGFGSLKSLKRIGHITPSSNTAVEPMTALLNAPLVDRVSHHFTRIRVTQITMGDSTKSQFAFDKMLAAAELLSDAPLDAIVWNGTAASWLGVEGTRSSADRSRSGAAWALGAALLDRAHIRIDSLYTTPAAYARRACDSPVPGLLRSQRPISGSRSMLSLPTTRPM